MKLAIAAVEVSFLRTAALSLVWRQTTCTMPHPNLLFNPSATKRWIVSKPQPVLPGRGIVSDVKAGQARSATSQPFC